MNPFNRANRAVIETLNDCDENLYVETFVLGENFSNEQMFHVNVNIHAKNSRNQQ